MSESLIKVTVVDSQGNIFSREWKATANRLDAIRWTVESCDVKYCVDADKIVRVEIADV